MGFSRQEAIGALELTNLDLDQALALLLDERRR